MIYYSYHIASSGDYYIFSGNFKILGLPVKVYAKFENVGTLISKIFRQFIRHYTVKLSAQSEGCTINYKLVGNGTGNE